MAKKKTPGLIKRVGIWHIDKQISGRRICRSTGADQLIGAERFLARLTEEARQASIHGVRPTETFEQAAAKFMLENQHKRSLRSDIDRLKLLMPWIGNITIDKIHTSTHSNSNAHTSDTGSAFHDLWVTSDSAQGLRCSSLLFVIYLGIHGPLAPEGIHQPYVYRVLLMTGLCRVA